LLCRKRIMFGNALQKLMGTVYIIYGVSALPIQTPELQVNCLEVSDHSGTWIGRNVCD
jgi:hypothetical protein